MIPEFDWTVVGGGIAGISLAEILTRQGHSVILLEKNEKLGSETTKVFHEWFHSGSLYSLVPDRLLTLRYLLGATDDLLEYYSSFSRMNLAATSSGVFVQPSDGWFNNDHIDYCYRMRRLNPVWMALVSRSINLVNLINDHDWLRRRAGSEYGPRVLKSHYWIDYLSKLYGSDEQFYSIESPDFTINSRVLINDLLTSARVNGLDVRLCCKAEEIYDHGAYVEIKSDIGNFRSRKVVVCSPDLLSELYGYRVKKSFAPMAVVDNLPVSQRNFVELDYYPKNCINLLTKGDGIGLVGGISLRRESEVDNYLRFVLDRHKQKNPELNVLDTYIGVKKELVGDSEDRNYLYHIDQRSNNIWSVVLGKFSLAFSMAPEFYRRLYRVNPSRYFDATLEYNFNNDVSDTSWQEIVANK